MHIQARDERSARKVLARIARELDRELMVATTLEAAVFETLRLATAWSYNWTVGQPEEFPTGQWAFEGTSNGNFRVAGVEFATFALD